MVGSLIAALDNPVDLVVLLVFAFLLFGKQLPEVARSLGKGIRELKESTNFSEVTEALNSVNEVRSVVSPTTIARATVPGVATLQDTVGAARDLVNPFAAPAEPAPLAVEADPVQPTASSPVPVENPAPILSSAPVESAAPASSPAPVPVPAEAPVAETETA
jgi:TatA/E family protein of Tat protein translocase